MTTLRFFLGLVFSTALVGSLVVVVPVSAQTYTARAIAAGSSVYGTYPYEFTGLLTTPVKPDGSSSTGSGAVVGNPRVVYSCAHVPFDNGAVDPWVNGIRWHRVWASAGYPASSAGQLLRSYFYYVGYAAAARINPISGLSFSQDFVVHYAYENTANGGYALSRNDGVTQLKSTSAKLITGYPSGLYPLGDSRKFLMHQTGPFNGAYLSHTADYLTIN